MNPRESEKDRDGPSEQVRTGSVQIFGRITLVMTPVWCLDVPRSKDQRVERLVDLSVHETPQHVRVFQRQSGWSVGLDLVLVQA